MFIYLKQIMFITEQTNSYLMLPNSGDKIMMVTIIYNY